MKKYFNSIKKDMEADKEKYTGDFNIVYWAGYIHGLHGASLLTWDERNELINYSQALFCPHLFEEEENDEQTGEQGTNDSPKKTLPDKGKAISC